MGNCLLILETRFPRRRNALFPVLHRADNAYVPTEVEPYGSRVSTRRCHLLREERPHATRSRPIYRSRPSADGHAAPGATKPADRPHRTPRCRRVWTRPIRERTQTVPASSQNRLRCIGVLARATDRNQGPGSRPPSCLNCRGACPDRSLRDCLGVEQPTSGRCSTDESVVPSIVANRRHPILPWALVPFEVRSWPLPQPLRPRALRPSVIPPQVWQWPPK
jgi:hypothetical protein